MITTVTKAAELREGDRIISIGERITYSKSMTVVGELAPLELGSPVYGVRLANPRRSSRIEYVLYPAHIDGQQIVIERPHHAA